MSFRLANSISVATYLEFLIRSNSLYSSVEAAVFGVCWSHNLFGNPNPCESSLVTIILESAKSSL